MTTQEALTRTILLTRDFVRVDAASDEEVQQALLASKVSIVADARNLAHPSGQTLLTALVVELLQTGTTVRLVVPEAPLLSPQPPLGGRELRQALVDLSSDLIPGVSALVSETAEPEYPVFVLGDTSWVGAAPAAWRVCGGRGWASLSPIDEPGTPWTDTFPIGAIAAASLAAAEPYKAVVRALAERRGVSHHYAELDPTRAARVVLNCDEPSPHVALGDCDFVSGGAITNAALFALYRVPGISGQLRIFDPEPLDASNLNRYALARRRHVGEYKVDILSSYAPPGLTIHPVRGRFEESTLPTFRPVAPVVAVGADALPPRWLAQAEHPHWLGVGSTTHFAAVTSSHLAGGTCAACLHPRDDGVNADIPTVSFVSWWAGLLLAARLLGSAGGTRSPLQEVHHLWPLRLDLPRSQTWATTPRASDCPLGHTT